MPSEAPIVVVDAEEEAKTVAVTATQTASATPASGAQPMRRDDNEAKLGAVRAEGRGCGAVRWRGPPQVRFPGGAVGRLIGGAALGMRHYTRSGFRRRR